MSILLLVHGLGMGAGSSAAATAPASVFTRAVLRQTRNHLALAQGSNNALRIVNKQLVRPDFPYTFPIDFDEFELGRTYGPGRVRLIS